MQKTVQKQIKYDKLQERLNNIPSLKERACLKCIYGNLARVGEVVEARYDRAGNPAITPANLDISDTFLITTLLTEKRKVSRRVPISRMDDPAQEYLKKGEPWITEDVIEYANGVGAESALWGYSTRWAQRVFQKHFPEYNQHIHLLRHWRTTHLLNGVATGVKMPDRIVAKMGGWKGTATLTSTYDGTTIEDYVSLRPKPTGVV